MFYYYISTLMKDIDITINLIKLTGIISPRKQIIKKYFPPPPHVSVNKGLIHHATLKTIVDDETSTISLTKSLCVAGP